MELVDLLLWEGRLSVSTATFVTTKEIAEALRITKRQITNYVRAGDIRAIGKLGTRRSAPYIITKEDADDFIAWYREWRGTRG